MKCNNLEGAMMEIVIDNLAMDIKLEFPNAIGISLPFSSIMI
jgi:hypothetical protein